MTKFALGRLYDPYFRPDGVDGIDGVDGDYFRRFFTDTLGITTDCTWEIYVGELKELKRLGRQDSDTITGIYKALDVLRPSIIAISKDHIK